MEGWLFLIFSKRNRVVGFLLMHSEVVVEFVTLIIKVFWANQLVGWDEPPHHQRLLCNTGGGVLLYPSSSTFYSLSSEDKPPLSFFPSLLSLSFLLRIVKYGTYL